MTRPFRLPMRPSERDNRAPTHRDRDRSRSPARVRAPLRERNVDLLNAAGSNSADTNVILAFRPKTRRDDKDITAWMSGAQMYGAQSSATPRGPAPSIAASELESDADDVTIKTFQASVAMPASTLSHYREAQAFAMRNPTSLRTSGQYLTHRAHLEAINTFWGGCPSKVLSPPLIPKKVRAPTAPAGGTYGPLDPMEWEPDLVKGLRMLAPLCSAKEASLWLMTEMKEDRRDLHTDNDFMTKHTVHAVYTMFVNKGYKPKTLVQAQKENKEKDAMIKNSYSSATGFYDPRKNAFSPATAYAPGKPSAEVLAAIKNQTVKFKFPWEMDDTPTTPK